MYWSIKWHKAETCAETSLVDVLDKLSKPLLAKLQFVLYMHWFQQILLTIIRKCKEILHNRHNYQCHRLCEKTFSNWGQWNRFFFSPSENVWSRPGCNLALYYRHRPGVVSTRLHKCTHTYTPTREMVGWRYAVHREPFTLFPFLGSVNGLI